MKRTAAALFLGTILALASCGSTENEEGQGGVYAKFDGELERGAVLRILENDTAVKQGYLKELLDGFNEKYKEYGIVAVDANMDEYSDLENDGPYGYGPDILYQANDSLMKYVYGKHLTPLPVERLGSLSFHGGRNHVYLRGPHQYPDIPHVLSRGPAPGRFRQERERDSRHVRELERALPIFQANP